MENPRKSQVSLFYNGKNVDQSISKSFSSFTYTDIASGQADTLAISLIDKDNNWVSKWSPVEGDYVNATISVENWNKLNDNRKLNCGKFLIDDYSFSGPPDIYNLNAIATPIDTDFASTKKSKNWSNVTVKSIANSISKSSGMQLVYDATNYSIKKISQSDETDMSFLFKVCESYNLSMKLFNNKLVVFQEEEYEKKLVVGKIDKTDCGTYDLNGTLIGIYHGVEIKYKDSKTNKTYTYKYTAKSGNRILKLNDKADSYRDAELKSKAALRKHNKSAYTIILTLKGDIKYIAGNCYDITGFGKFNGKYYLDKVKHTISGGYSVTLELHKVV